MQAQLCAFFFKNVDLVNDTFVLSTNSIKMSEMLKCHVLAVVAFVNVHRE